MKISKIYKEIDGILNKLDFERLWKGFKRYNFALYNDEIVCFGDNCIAVDNRFLGNTAIDYNGEKIAIWKVSAKDFENLNVLASNIVHEMFHAFQFENNESRFPNDLKGLNKAFDIEYYGMKKQEGILLVNAIKTDNMKLRISELEKIITLREKRAELYRDSTEYEFSIETVEGTAEYVGTKALKNIDKEEYEKRIHKYMEMIVDNKMIFDTRRYSYFYGTLLLILVDSLNIKLSQEIENNDKTIMENLMGMVNNGKGIGDISIGLDLDLEEGLNKYKKNILMKFEKFNDKKRENHPGIYKIIGYDPMNMYKLENKILHEHCVNIYDNSTEKTLFINGPVITIYNKDESQIIDYLI